VQESVFVLVGTVSYQDNHHGVNANDSLDTPKFFHVDPSNHLIVQRVVLVPVVIQSQSESQGDSSGSARSTFHLFKASQEHTAFPGNRGEACRLTLEDSLDIGELKPSEGVKGLRLFFTRDQIRGVAWSDSELYVGDAWTLQAK
jgi:hypothetical protein